MNSTDPILSIIIPTFNSDRTISTAVQSILEQTFSDFEVLIMDNVSTDNTVEIAKSFRDERIKVYSDKDQGIYDAMNKGIDFAKATWLYFLGSDDQLYNRTTLQEVFEVPFIERYNVVYGNVEIVGNTTWAKNGDIFDGEYDLKKIIAKNICHQGIFYKKEFVEVIGYYNRNYKLCSDWDYNLRCWANTKFLFIDKTIALFHGGGASTKTNVDEQFAMDFAQNFISYFGLSPFDPLINNEGVWFYNEVLAYQKKNNFYKYFLRKIKSKFSLHTQF